MIAIVDYKMGNLRSVENALRRLGTEFVVTADAEIAKSILKTIAREIIFFIFSSSLFFIFIFCLFG